MSKDNRGRAWLVVGMLAILPVIVSCGQGDNPDGQQSGAPSSMGAGQPAGAARAPARPVVAETLPYAEVDDELVYGHFVFPSDMVDPLPAMIVIHEWWGLNDDVRAMADRLAGEGYIVLAVDLFYGKTAQHPAEARERMLEVVENPEPANENLRQAYQFVNETAGAPRTGVLGWGFGGGWALNAAMLMPRELDAVVVYYGQVIADRAKLESLDMPILGLFAGEDRGTPVANVREFEKALDALDKNHEIIVYPGVGQAFANPNGSNYDPRSAQLAWEKTLSFLDFHLGVGRAR